MLMSSRKSTSLVAATRGANIALVRFLSAAFGVALSLLLIYSVWSMRRYGDLASGIAFLDGAVLTANDSSLMLENVFEGDSVEGEFVVKNVTARPLVVLDAIPACSCLKIMSKLPMNVPRFSTATLRIRFAASS